VVGPLGRGVSRDDREVIATGRAGPGREFTVGTNTLFTCLHTDSAVEIAPGQQATTRQILWFVYGTLDDLLRRLRQEFPAVISLPPRGARRSSPSSPQNNTTQLIIALQPLQAVCASLLAGHWNTPKHPPAMVNPRRVTAAVPAPDGPCRPWEKPLN
jgi:hypothetical protein